MSKAPEGLDRTDLANLVRGTEPHYDVMGHPLVKRAGSFTGGHVDQWNWRYKFEDDGFTDEELWELYQVCKQSWK